MLKYAPMVSAPCILLASTVVVLGSGRLLAGSILAGMTLSLVLVFMVRLKVDGEGRRG